MKRTVTHQPTHTLVTDPTEAEIQKEAYCLWLDNGRPEGRDLEFWHAAREILRHRTAPTGHVTHSPVTHVTFPAKKSRPQTADTNR